MAPDVVTSATRWLRIKIDSETATHMNRQPLQFAIIFASTILTLSATSFAAEERPSKSPNIIVILADDMGPGEPSYAGGLIPTPALDRLANEGMRFTDAHTSSSVCTPTRYGILTGRYNWRSRLKSGVLTAVNSPALMDPNRKSLPKFLKEAGYHTACVGKWHLGVDWIGNDNTDPNDALKKKDFGSWSVEYGQPFKNGPVDIGFDEAFFILSSLDMPPYTYLRNNRVVTAPTVSRGFPHNEYNDYQRVGAAAKNFDPSECLANWAAESRSYIKKRAQDKTQKPFFLYLPLTSPHTPIAPGKRFKGRYKQFSWYADFIAETDWVVAEVLAQLKESEIEDNTLVIFTSDNGFAPYVKIPKMLAAGYRPSGTFRGAKASAYEGGHRVPFLVRWPGKVAADSQCDTTICTTDFFATFAEILGKQDAVPDNAAEDSFSFSRCFEDNQYPARPFTIHHSMNGKFAIRKGDWKLILSIDGGGGWGDLPWETEITTTSQEVQLFNLKNDPGERRNLEVTNPAKVDELVNDLATALHNGRTTPGTKQTNDGWPYCHQPTLKTYPQLKEADVVEPRQ
ncbi:sulfatase family protein [Rubripirellula reticaptiva]|uniref:Arylsulfatase n=1 Tax=Rubripirellula reticaptiva TaxID=2528013 RepID=A0A5C6F338_9BACT|nr:arylsulfatase [Rubripirellula reticaptiva]TWU55602.1 Arylsulfatase [Rubripirellula reticaptiva]